MMNNEYYELIEYCEDEEGMLVGRINCFCVIVRSPSHITEWIFDRWKDLMEIDKRVV